MIELKKQGKVKNVGVSNYNVKHIEEIEAAGLRNAFN
jgi:2,5-diketo-D-gluconate reductase A